MAGMIVALVRMLVLIWMVMKMMLLMMMTNMTMPDLLDGDSDRLHNRVLLIFFIFFIYNRHHHPEDFNVLACSSLDL